MQRRSEVASVRDDKVQDRIKRTIIAISGRRGRLGDLVQWSYGFESVIVHYRRSDSELFTSDVPTSRGDTPEAPPESHHQPFAGTLRILPSE